CLPVAASLASGEGRRAGFASFRVGKTRRKPGLWGDVPSEQAETLLCYLKTQNRKRREPMLVTKTLVALGFLGAMALGTPAPSLAQGVYIGPGGVGIDTGRPAYRERYYRGDR